MDLFLWILTGILAAVFLLSGLTKTSTPHEKLADYPLMGWTSDFSPSFVRAVGFAEVFGAVGIVLPQATNILQPITPLSAFGLAVIMAFSTLVLHRRGELRRTAPLNAALFAIALIVAFGRALA